jgi:RNA ligase
VLDYGKLEGLMYLGSVDIDDGSSYWNGMLMTLYGIPKNMALQFGTYAGVMSDLDLHRKNAEGFVIFNDYTGERLKVKQEDYIELHRVMTGLNEKQLWEWLSQGKTINEILSDLPEELHQWATPVLSRLVDDYLEFDLKVHQAFLESYHWGRKDFAVFNAGKEPVTRAALFAKYDGNDARVSEIIWKALKP